ncbi:MAG: hypothetical protein J5663_11085 [Bacteroidaceae bacterium]|nr:hypothetical protein [Bacteroidaceae bacterium]
MKSNGIILVMASAIMMSAASCGSDKEDELGNWEPMAWEHDGYKRDAAGNIEVPEAGGDYTFICQNYKPWVCGAESASDECVMHYYYSSDTGAVVVPYDEPDTVEVDSATLDSINSMPPSYPVKTFNTPYYVEMVDSVHVVCTDYSVRVIIPASKNRRTLKVNLTAGDIFDDKCFIQNADKK